VLLCTVFARAVRGPPRHGLCGAFSALRAAAVRQCHHHWMRGTVLLVDNDRSFLVDVDLFRANGLIVYHCHEPDQALKQFHDIGAEVIVVLSARHSRSIVPALRGLADHATSIVVVSVPEERDEARRAGADLFLLNSARPADLLYEINRALILRRSGRRLPWNW
jgi:DNA-binding NarL/FixJ family response regulator